MTLRNSQILHEAMCGGSHAEVGGKALKFFLNQNAKLALGFS